MDNTTRAQQRLVDRGLNLEVDGDFGAASYAALMTFIAGKTAPTLLRQELGRAAAKHFPGADITTPLRVAHALAQQSVETGGFARVVESLNYSPDGLRKTFGAKRIAPADCDRLGRKSSEAVVPFDRQEAIGNIVYGGEFGRKQLGNTHPGDGWKYRGRGAKQTTGLANYADVASVTGIDVVAHPDRLEDADLGMRAACIFWVNRHCSTPADADQIEALTRAVNGGLNGIADRKAALARAKLILL